MSERAFPVPDSWCSTSYEMAGKDRKDTWLPNTNAESPFENEPSRNISHFEYSPHIHAETGQSRTNGVQRRGHSSAWRAKSEEVQQTCGLTPQGAS